jgi:hypothetical protein
LPNSAVAYFIYRAVPCVLLHLDSKTLVLSIHWFYQSASHSHHCLIGMEMIPFWKELVSSLEDLRKNFPYYSIDCRTLTVSSLQCPKILNSLNWQNASL